MVILCNIHGRTVWCSVAAVSAMRIPSLFAHSVRVLPECPPCIRVHENGRGRALLSSIALLN